MCRGIRFVWLAVMLVFEYDRECPSPRFCRGGASGRRSSAALMAEPAELHLERRAEKQVLLQLLTEKIRTI